jgi:hypothetical protein
MCTFTESKDIEYTEGTRKDYEYFEIETKNQDYEYNCFTMLM